jgi:tRNA dimethylallyltransferase
MPNNTKNCLIVIVGPTGIGKTSLSIELAKKLNTEIISADSRQFYKELKIGTATPSEKQLNTVKHHFINNLSVKDYYNVSMFEEQAINVLKKIFINHRYAIMVGGSGLYINAVCDGIDILPNPDQTIREKIKNIYEEKGINELQKQLKTLDPEYFSVVDTNNPKRLMRAIEVCLQTGEKYSSLRTNKSKTRNFKIIKIGLICNRKELYSVINKRVDMMLKQGLINEAKNLYNLNDYKKINALNTVGYKEIFAHLDNKTNIKQAIENIKTNTRRYAKRQLTWFKKDISITWFHPDEKQKITDFIKKC